MPTIEKQIGVDLEATRKALRLTQLELIEKLGMAPATYAVIIDKKRSENRGFSIKTVKIIEQFLKENKGILKKNTQKIPSVAEIFKEGAKKYPEARARRVDPIELFSQYGKVMSVEGEEKKYYSEEEVRKIIGMTLNINDIK